MINSKLRQVNLMNQVKGTGFLIIKKIVRDRGPATEKKFLESLTPQERVAWDTDKILAISWNPLPSKPEGSGLYEAAQALFPGDPNHALRELGRVMAKEGLPRFYQIFIRIPTVQFIWKRVAALWRSFYDTGDAVMENPGPRQATFVLRNYPEYPPYMREYLCGYFIGMGDLVGLKTMVVRKDETDPRAWKWHLQWS
jgi:hypothetical protein